MTNYACNRHYLLWLGGYIIKASFEITVWFLEEFWAKIEKRQKTHKICLIVLINPSWYSFLEKIILDIQVCIPREHPFQISSRSDYCIAADIMWKIPKMTKNDSLQNRGVVPTIQPKTDCPGQTVFVRS